MPHPERAAKGMESSLQFGLVWRNSSTIGDPNHMTELINKYSNIKTIRILLKSAHAINKLFFLVLN